MFTKAPKRNKSSKCIGVMLVLFIILSLTVPGVANADDSTYMEWTPKFNYTFAVYDGTEKVFRITNGPGTEEFDNALLDFIDEKDANNYDITNIYFYKKASGVKDSLSPNNILKATEPTSMTIPEIEIFYEGENKGYTVYKESLNETFTLDKRDLNIMPCEVIYAHDGNMKSPREYEIVDGTSLANGHYITEVEYGTYGTDVGLYDSYVNDIVIKDGLGDNATDVTKNYRINYLPGELYIVDFSGGQAPNPDPDDGVIVSPPDLANPTNDNASNTRSTTNVGSIGSNVAGSTASNNANTAANTNTQTISDNQIALDSGSGLSNAIESIEGGANMNLALALFVAIFIVATVVTIAGLNMYKRMRVRKGEYYN